VGGGNSGETVEVVEVSGSLIFLKSAHFPGIKPLYVYRKEDLEAVSLLGGLVPFEEKKK
jgi:hypothetical protein